MKSNPPALLVGKANGKLKGDNAVFTATRASGKSAEFYRLLAAP